MGKPRNVGRDIALSLGAGVLFAAGLVTYLMQTIPSREELLAAPSPATHTAPDPALTADLDAAAAVLQRFVAHLAAGQHDAAYALMAAPYQATHSLDAFRETCTGSPFLTGVQKSVLLRTTRLSVPGGNYTMQGRGMLVASAGSVDANFTFMVNGGVNGGVNGAELRILVLSLGGVPVLDGISGKR